MDIGPIVRWLLRQKSEPAPEEETDEERAAKARAGAQAIADRLPSAVMPRAGLAEDKRRKAMIDKQLREGAE